MPNEGSLFGTPNIYFTKFLKLSTTSEKKLSLYLKLKKNKFTVY